MKTERVTVPMEKHQKEWTIENAKLRGHEDMATYIRWLIWKDRERLITERKVQ